MQRMFGKTAVWLLITAQLAAMAFAAAQGLPEGEGKQLVEGKCASCHGLDKIESQRLDHDAWKKLVIKMVGYGAPLDDKEVDIAVDYLTRYLGAQASAAAVSEDEKTAQKHIDGICSTCHDSELIKTTQATKEEWIEIVKKMNSKGAGLSEGDVELLAEYLARKYGPK